MGNEKIIYSVIIIAVMTQFICAGISCVAIFPYEPPIKEFSMRTEGKGLSTFNYFNENLNFSKD